MFYSFFWVCLVEIRENEKSRGFSEFNGFKTRPDQTRPGDIYLNQSKSKLNHSF